MTTAANDHRGRVPHRERHGPAADHELGAAGVAVDVGAGLRRRLEGPLRAVGRRERSLERHLELSRRGTGCSRWARRTFPRSGGWCGPRSLGRCRRHRPRPASVAGGDGDTSEGKRRWRGSCDAWCPREGDRRSREGTTPARLQARERVGRSERARPTRVSGYQVARAGQAGNCCALAMDGFHPGGFPALMVIRKAVDVRRDGRAGHGGGGVPGPVAVIAGLPVFAGAVVVSPKRGVGDAVAGAARPLRGAADPDGLLFVPPLSVVPWQ